MLMKVYQKMLGEICKIKITIKNETPVYRPLNKAVIARYDFKTLQSVEIIVAQFSPWIPDTIKAWNKTGQYFMGMYVFRILPGSWTKSLR